MINIATNIVAEIVSWDNRTFVIFAGAAIVCVISMLMHHIIWCIYILKFDAGWACILVRANAIMAVLIYVSIGILMDCMTGVILTGLLLASIFAFGMYNNSEYSY